MAQMDAFFAGRPEEWAICEALRTAILARWPGTSIRVMKSCVSFDDPKPFCYASHPPRKSMQGLLVTFSQTEFARHPRFFMVVPINKKRNTVHVLVEDASRVDEELLGFLAASRR